MKISKKLMVVSLAPFLLLLVGLLTCGYLFQKGNEATRHYISDYAERKALLSDIYQTFGYGGAIHSFKNYVLRRQPHYQEQALKELQQGLTLLEVYQEFEPLAEEEKRVLEVLDQTMKLYLSKIPIAEKLIAQGASIAEVDKAVKVSDTEAIQAISNLHSYFFKQRDIELNKLESVQNQIFTIITVIFGLALIFAIFSSEIVSAKMMRSVKQLMQISNQISQGDYYVTKDRILDSKDELALLGQQMVDMGRSLDLAFNRLQKSNEDLEQFAFVASHDLQEPVKKILIFSDFLEQEEGEKLSEGGRAYLGKIKKSSLRMRELVNALLNYARLARSEMDFEEIDLNDLVCDVLEDLEVAVQRSKAEVKVAPLPKVTGNRNLLNQLFYNLISNSLKFAKPQTQPHIEILAEKGPGMNWEISVKDQGVGFEMQHVATILKPFGRAHNKMDYPGVGIGLATCSKILLAHQTEFHIESEPDHGAKFSFLLQAV